MTPYQVVWDGRRNGPGGAYLVTEPDVAQSEAIDRREELEALRRRVLLVLDEGPQTLHELADRLQVSTDIVGRALAVLRGRGAVEKCGERPWLGRPPHWRGRTLSVYRRVDWSTGE